MVSKRCSYGIACCRLISDGPQVLMVKKRYTYSYFDFIMGRYKGINDIVRLQYLFNNMTFHEKLDILNCDFEKMWYRIWLGSPEKEKKENGYFKNLTSYKFNNSKTLNTPNLDRIYKSKKKRFESNFGNQYGKDRLRDMINHSTSSEKVWEIPKGGKKGIEKPMDTAIREFNEETNLMTKNYYIYFDIKPKVESYIDGGTLWKNIYYIAEINEVYKEPKLDFFSHQVNEIEAIKWVGFRDIEFLDLNNKTKKRVKKFLKHLFYIYKKARSEI